MIFLVIGGSVGAFIAFRIPMTAMPELVAGFHSLVGLAAVFVAISAFLKPEAFGLGIVGNIKLADINTPAMPNRHTWAHKLAYTEWFEDEIAAGLPWARIKHRLEEKYLR